MALIAIALQDTEQGLEFRVISEPEIKLDTDPEALTPAQAMALVALHAVKSAIPPLPEEQS